ncbi:MAG TPA: hypothetical protein VGH28_05955 [Polyangiaceae bacterium]
MRILPLLLLAACAPVEAHPDAVAPLAADRAHYFWENHDYESGRFTELRAGGSYRTVSREHARVAESDAGRWRQGSNGDLLLCSSYRFRFVEAGPLWIIVDTEGVHDRLPELGGAIRAFLRAHAEPSFDSEEVERIEGAGTSVESTAYGRRVTREELASLAGAIDAYLARGDENLFSTTPRRHRGTLYLAGAWDVPAPPRDAKSVSALELGIEHDDTTLAVPAIDETLFRESIARPQPFPAPFSLNVLPPAPVKMVDMKPERVTPRCASFDR